MGRFSFRIFHNCAKRLPKRPVPLGKFDIIYLKCYNYIIQNFIRRSSMNDSITIKMKHLAIFCAAFVVIVLGGGGLVANTYLDKYEAVRAENLELQTQLRQVNGDVEQQLKDAERTLELIRS